MHYRQAQSSDAMNMAIAGILQANADLIFLNPVRLNRTRTSYKNGAGAEGLATPGLNMIRERARLTSTPDFRSRQHLFRPSKVNNFKAFDRSEHSRSTASPGLL